MWLINTETLVLEPFQACPSDTYAILSHTWGSDAEELNFDEFRAGKGRQKSGFRKIWMCCEQAQKDNLKYAWVDTCCIDKRSSTELSEAINSMFSWYASARVCYAYLADINRYDPLIPQNDPQSFLNSYYYSRGWTLQELIAPRSVFFYTRGWQLIGERSDLADDLHNITGIATDVLKLQRSFLDCSIAQRMSWASKRQTTRVEDGAYCLIGLFNVNMPLLYGEGSKAFLRLQQQIIEQSDDETIFAWTGVAEDGSGLLAPNPAHFSDAMNIQRKVEVAKDLRTRSQIEVYQSNAR